MNPGRWERMAKAYADLGLGDDGVSLEGFIYNPNPLSQLEKLKKTLLVVSSVGGVLLCVMIGLLWVWLRLRHEVALRREAEEQVRLLAYNDSLTGIANRNSFLAYANKQIHLGLRNHQKFALCFIDLNGFKVVNDSYGHQAGDVVLVHVAKAISSSIRESDMAARYGGDEFVVLLAGVRDVEGVKRVIAQIRCAIAVVVELKDVSISITSSIGAAIFPDDGTQIDTLISKADKLMFEEKTAAKSEGSPFIA